MKLLIGLLLASTLLVACESKDAREYDTAMEYQAKEAESDWCTNVSYSINYTGMPPANYTCGQLSKMIELDYFPTNYTVTSTTYCYDSRHNDTEGNTVVQAYHEPIHSGEYKFQYIMRCNESVKNE